MAVNELIFNNKVIFAGGAQISSGQPLSLPVSASDPLSPNNGDMYYNSVDNVAKIYQNGAWEIVSVSGGSASYFVNKVTLNATDITNKFVTLTDIPTSPSDTILDIVGGITQDHSVDFTVTGNQLSWNGLGLDGILADGDKLIIQFN
jgi:hypothetical protein